MKDYPRIGAIQKRHKKGNCKICSANKCDRVVEIEFNYMRGDDEIYQVHQSCIDGFLKQELIDRLIGSKK